MRKIITAAIIAGALPLVACGNGDESTPTFTDETSTTTATSTTAATASTDAQISDTPKVTQPSEWKAVRDMGKSIHAATGNCSSLNWEDNGMTACGDADVGYIMALDTTEYPRAVDMFSQFIPELIREEPEAVRDGSVVALAGDGWGLLCIPVDDGSSLQVAPRNHCTKIYSQIPSSQWVNLETHVEVDRPNSSAESENGFGDGTHLVGADIQPGTYRTDGGEGCYWERQAGLSGTSADLITNDYSGSKKQTYVTIAASDVGFYSNRCGAWELVE